MKRFFLDTNVLVYGLDDTHSVKRRRSLSLTERALEDGSGIISSQVVQECLHLMLRKFRHQISASDARLYLDQVLMPLCQVFPDGDLFSEALLIAAQTGWRFYDSLIVSAAVKANCDVLLTEDWQHGRTIRGVTIQNPFV
jgi:predicted nucleic acid-binding protein